jgi:hypothetical protein
MLEMIVASNDNTIIRPTDVATDAAAGRWIKSGSVTITQSCNIPGKRTYQSSLAERDKLIEQRMLITKGGSVDNPG